MRLGYYTSMAVTSVGGQVWVKHLQKFPRFIVKMAMKHPHLKDVFLFWYFFLTFSSFLCLPSFSFSPLASWHLLSFPPFPSTSWHLETYRWPTQWGVRHSQIYPQRVCVIVSARGIYTKDLGQHICRMRFGPKSVEVRNEMSCRKFQNATKRRWK